MLILNINEEGRGGGPLNRILLVASALKNIEVDTVILCPLYAHDYLNKCHQKKVRTEAILLHFVSKNIYRIFIYIITFPGDLIRIASVIRRLNRISSIAMAPFR